jgi:TP901 family phage tail tape measure protein
MADVNARLGVSLDTSDALAQLKDLQRRISQFHSSIANTSDAAAVAQRKLQANFVNSINAIGGFAAELRTVKTTAETFTNSLEKNKLSLGQYFKFAAGSTKTFGKFFASEMQTIEKTAIERVKTIQTQYVKLGRDATGAMQSIAIRPTVLDMRDLGTQTQIAAQKQVLFNQLIRQGSTNLLNFGKNTQWAGRQLMVGFTLPLITLGSAASKTFMQMEAQVIKFRKVYGDLFTPTEERDKALQQIKDLGAEFTKYGIAVESTIGLAAEAAAAGFAGLDLQNQTIAATRLSILGQLDNQKALETTISLQNAFRMSSEDLASAIDFLNAVENQTVVSLDDITTAIPKVAPVIQSLGGNVKDLAFFLAAMKEGGVNASQGANALKSGLASLINPSDKAAQMLGSLGINIRNIITRNQGDLRNTVLDFARALDKLDPLKRAQAIEQLFGKFQFARISTLFDNVIRDGTQASRVLDLASSSVEDLANMSEQELGMTAESAMNKFLKTVEGLKAALAPVGEVFLQTITPFLDGIGKIVEGFNNLPSDFKKIVTLLVTLVGGLGPIFLMTFGLIANGIANSIKFINLLRNGFLRLTGQSTVLGETTEYMTNEQLQAAAAAASLDQAHQKLIQRFTAETAVVHQLRDAYEQALAAGNKFALMNPGMMRAGAPKKFASGGFVSGSGSRDTVPAMLTPGEFVVKKDQAKIFLPLLEKINSGKIPGFSLGGFIGMPKSNKHVQKEREVGEQIYEMFKKSSYANVPPRQYGHQLAKSTGHSFPLFGVGGVYMSPEGKRVFVKPVVNETAAVAEMRATEIARKAHGLKAPQQKIVVMQDPTDVRRQRKFLALESPLDPTFINNDPMAVFNEEQYFRQLVASLLRADKDLSASNVFGNVVADVGPAGVFSKASGIRNYADNLTSMEQQAVINLLGIKGGAKKAFAQSTVSLMAGLTPQQYHQKMIAEIQQVLPLLKQTVAGFNLTNPREIKVYSDMIGRLEQGLLVDWSKFHAMHSAVKPPKEFATGGFVSGSGSKDTVPAMLTPGEFVVNKQQAKVFMPLLQAINAGRVPGFNGGGSVGKTVSLGGKNFDIPEKSFKAVSRLLSVFERALVPADRVVKLFEALEARQEKITRKSLVMEAKKQEVPTTVPLVKGHIQGSLGVLPNGDRILGSLTRDMTQVQNKAIEYGQKVEEFKKHWFGITDGLIGTVKQGGVKVTDGIRKAAQQIDNEIGELAIEMAEGGVVTATILNKATEKIRKKYRDQNTELGLVVGAMDRQAGKRVSVPPEFSQEEMRKDIAGKLKSGEAWLAKGQTQIKSIVDGTVRVIARVPTRIAEEANKALNKIEQIKTLMSGRILPRERRPIDPRSETYLPQQIEARIVDPSIISNAKKAGQQAAIARVQEQEKILSQEKNDPAVMQKSKKRNSPHPIVGDMAEDDARLYNQVFEQQLQKTRARRASSGGTIMFDEKAGNYKNEQAFRKQEQSRQIALQRVTAMTVGKMSEFSNKLMGLSFGLSSVTGIVSMFGGEMSQITNIIFGVSNALFALTMVTGALTKATMVRKASEDFIAAGGIAGLAAGGTQKATGIAKALPVASGPMSKLANVFRGLSTIITTVAGGFLRFIPIIAAVATAFMAYQFFADMAKQQKEKIEALGNTAMMSAEKIKKLGDIVGATVKATPLSEAKPTISATGGAAAPEKRSMVQSILASENFATDFAAEIKAIRQAGKEQAQLVLQSLAINLAGQGFAKEQVDGIVSAILTEAGRRDVKINFRSLDLNVQKNREALGKQLDFQIRQFENTFKPVDELNKRLGKGLGEDSRKALSDLGGTFSAIFNGISGQLANGVITADAFNAQFKELSDRLYAIKDPATSLALIQNIMESVNPELAKTITGIKDLKTQIILLKAASVGLTPTPEQVKAFQTMSDPKSSPEQLAAASKIVEEYVNNYTKLIAAMEEAAKIPPPPPPTPEEELGLANAELEKMVENLENQTTAYNALVDAGYDAEEALELIGNQTLANAIASNGLTEQTKALIDRYLELSKTLGGLKSSGTADLSPFENAIKSLESQRTEIKENALAYAKLRKAGLDIGTAFRVAEDPILAAALASTKVGTKKWDELLNKIKETDAAIRNSELKKLLLESKQELQLQREFSKIAPELAKAGFELEDIRDIMSDPTLAKKFIKEFEKAGNKAKFINDQLRAIQQRKAIEVKIKLATQAGSAEVANEVVANARRGLENQAAFIRRNREAGIKAAQDQVEALNKELEKVNDKIADIEEEISDKQRAITIEIERPIEELQKSINNLQRQIELEFERPLAALQEESSDLAEDLAVMDKAAEAVNEKYEAQEKALQDIAKINQQIINQQKKQISLADALSQGDISAAASIMQDMRAQAAEASAGSISDALATARQAELAGIRSASGMTREQIEQRQYEIARQTYRLEEQREAVQAKIQTIQDNIYSLEEQRELKLREIRDLEDKVYDLIEDQNNGQEALNKKIKTAELAVTDLEKALAAALKPVEDQLDQWELIELEIGKAETAGYNYIAMLNQAKAIIAGMGSLPGSTGTVPGAPSGSTPGATDDSNNTQTVIQKQIAELNRRIAITRWRVNNEQLTATQKNDLMALNIKRINEVKRLKGIPDMTGRIKPGTTTQIIDVPGFAKGGMIPGYAMGGLVSKPLLSDTVPAMLTPGEFVINRKASEQFAPLLSAINSGKSLSGLSNMLMSGSSILSNANRMSAPTFSDMGRYRSSNVTSKNNTVAPSANSVYNYSLSVNVNGSNVDANTIANTVMTKIQQIDSQRVRRQVAR